MEPFIARLQQAGRGVLLLDYDGTLAPFVVERERAFPYPGVRERLDRLMASGTTRLVIVSGRRVDELPGLLQLQQTPEMWGAHGWERALPDGKRWAATLPADGVVALQAAQAHARALEHRGLRLEAKPASLAAHWRGLAPEQAQRLRTELLASWSEIQPAALLELLDFDGGMELRVRGRSKADAVEIVLAEGERGVPAAYLGDDLTDEDAFAAIDGRGLAVLVRAQMRATRAHAFVRPPQELLQFLDLWLDTLPHAARPH